MFYKLEEYEGYSGPLTDVIQQILPVGGAGHTPLHCLIILLCIMVKFHLMMQIAVLWKRSATNAHSKPIRKSLPTYGLSAPYTGSHPR